MSTGLEVITPGLMTSVQDRGRFGFQALGISVSGALDPEDVEQGSRSSNPSTPPLLRLSGDHLLAIVNSIPRRGPFGRPR